MQERHHSVGATAHYEPAHTRTLAVAPVYTYRATSRNVYLPKLTGEHWIYFYGEVDYGVGGSTVSVPTTNITEFPLFFRRPIPPPPPALREATNFYSAARNDTVLCLGADCYGANGNYALQRVEGFGLLNDDGTGHVTLNGTTYPVTQLRLYFSATHNDNLITTNTTAPDGSYLPSGGGTDFQNGYVLAAPAPGALQLQLWFKKFTATNWDYATVASPDGVAWVTAQGYTLVSATTNGWVLPPA